MPRKFYIEERHELLNSQGGSFLSSFEKAHVETNPMAIISIRRSKTCRLCDLFIKLLQGFGLIQLCVSCLCTVHTTMMIAYVLYIRH